MANNENADGEEKRKAFISGVKKGVDTIKKIVQVFKRNPSVKAWAKRKRAEKQRLKREGKRGSELRSSLASWIARNPKPTGRTAKDSIQLAEDSNLVPRGTVQALTLPPSQTTKKAQPQFLVLILVALGFFLLSNRKY